MRKTTIKTTLKDKKTGETTIHKAISKSLDQPVKELQTRPKNLSDVTREEDSEEIEAQEEIENVLNQFKIQEAADEMTKFLRIKHKLPGLRPEFRYVDSRFPKEESGRTMSVSRFYASLNLCVDNITDKWTNEMIQAKKWCIEQAGFKYVWKQESEVVKVVGKEMLLVLESTTNEKNEILENTENFWGREKTIKQKPSFTFDMTPFSFTMGRGMGVINA